MKNQLKLTILSVTICLLLMGMSTSNLFAQKTFEGYWESETITKSTMPGMPSSEIETQKAFYKQGKMKIQQFTENSDIILRLDKDLSWTVDHANKSYQEVRFEDVEKEVKAAKSKMAEEMKKMSPEQQEMMKKMMGDKMGSMLGDAETPSISFKKTGETKTISGFKCKQVMMMLDGDPFMEMWLTPDYNLGDEFLKVYQNMGLLKGKLPNDVDLKGFPIYTKMEMDTGM
ncbi:MAG: hypothetical protein SCK70_12535, partial [bacterium]|nr:hypothetical protein [bacterium]